MQYEKAAGGSLLMNFKNIRISKDESHHILNGEPLYENRFKKVLSFHEPGLAPVEDESCAYHIRTDGSQAYEERYRMTLGFYCGLGAVMDDSGWYHITLGGVPAYGERYDWVGNFQENLCTVRSFNGSYYHIKPDGSEAYKEKYRYVGDFKYGIAVVYDTEGLAHHIYENGIPVNEKKFQELGIFHKGYAIARDEEGYFHIDQKGNPIYSDRFEWIEPFYNGQAFVKSKTGEVRVINKNGETVNWVTPPESPILLTQYRHELMDTMVGYWNTQILYCIVRSGILDELFSGNSDIIKLSKILRFPKRSIEMLMDICSIWNLITRPNHTLTQKGLMLLNEGPLHNAALMWGEEHYQVMGKLLDSLKTQEPQFENIFNKPLFDYFSNAEDDTYYNAMEEYSQDYQEIVEKLPLEGIRSIVDIGGATGNLLRFIINIFPNIEKAFLFDLPGVNIESDLCEGIRLIEGNFFTDSFPKTDSAILSRVLHDWPDDKCNNLLNSINRSLSLNGRIIILETIMPDEVTRDVGVRLNFNLLVSVGGRERKRNEFEKLLHESGFGNFEIIKTDSVVSIISATKENEIQ